MCHWVFQNLWRGKKTTKVEWESFVLTSTSCCCYQCIWASSINQSLSAQMLTWSTFNVHRPKKRNEIRWHLLCDNKKISSLILTFPPFNHWFVVDFLPLTIEWHFDSLRVLSLIWWFSFTSALGSLPTHPRTVHPRTGTARIKGKSGHDARIATINAGKLRQHGVWEGNRAHGRREHRAGAGSGDCGSIYSFSLLHERRLGCEWNVQLRSRLTLDGLEYVHRNVIVFRFRWADKRLSFVDLTKWGLRSNCTLSCLRSNRQLSQNSSN